MNPWLSLTLVLVCSGLFLAAATIYFMAHALLSPPRMSDGKAVVVLRRLSPEDLALKFQETRFDIRDESSGQQIRIAAWWIPAPQPVDRTVVIVHGYGDAKVGAIAWAPLFHSLGWNILTPDLRAHGESGGQYSTAGFWERHDLAQVLNRLKIDRPRETRKLIIFGVSLGAAAALAAIQKRDDVSALIMEGPFTSYRAAVAAHGELFGAPGGWMQKLALRLAESISKADFDSVRPLDLIPTAPCPLMIIHAADDCFMTSGQPEQLRQALQRHNDPRDVFWQVRGCGHVLGLAAGADEYALRVQEFLASAASATVNPDFHCDSANFR